MPVADHWLGDMCEAARGVYAELRRKQLTSGALYSAFVSRIEKKGAEAL